MTREEVFAYVKKEFGTVPDYPWLSDPEAAVLRHGDTKKWYGLVMPVRRRVLGLDEDEPVDILNVKTGPLLGASFHNQPGFFPAYHMNKKHWLTILLDGSAREEDIIALLNISYQLTDGAKKNKTQK